MSGEGGVSGGARFLRRVNDAVVAPVVLCLVVVACGGEDVRLGDGKRASAVTLDASTPSGDASPSADASPTVDAALPSFEIPVAIEAISGADTKDDDPSLTADLKELYFDSKRAGGTGKEDVWRSVRAAPADSWGEPSLVVEVDTAERETGIAVSRDGLSLWFSSDRSGGKGGLDVYVSQRQTRQDTWSEPVLVDELDSPGDDLVSSVNESSTVLFLARRNDGNDDYDLYVAERSGEGEPWSAPRAVAELDTDAEESDAFLLANGRDLIFTRSEDLYLAVRDGPTQPFAHATRFDDLDSKKDDRDGWTTPEFDYVVFSSDRDGSYKLYEAKRR